MRMYVFITNIESTPNKWPSLVLFFYGKVIARTHQLFLVSISRKVTLAQPPCWRITSGSLALTSCPNFRPKFIIGCWTSSTRHLKFKAAKNKISISLKNILSLSLICLEEWHHPQTMIKSKNIRINILLFHSFQPSIDKLIIGQISPLFSSFQSHIIPFLDCHSRTASGL